MEAEGLAGPGHQDFWARWRRYCWQIGEKHPLRLRVSQLPDKVA